VWLQVCHSCHLHTREGNIQEMLLHPANEHPQGRRSTTSSMQLHQHEAHFKMIRHACRCNAISLPMTAAAVVSAAPRALTLMEGIRRLLYSG
jgi:hypothetical protein